jgi:isoquinoline 1-oxidoreductase beta subunit
MTQVNRRDFLKLLAVTSGSLVLGVYLDACAETPEVLPTLTVLTATSTPVSRTPRAPFDWAPNMYVRVDNTGKLTVNAFRSEMGQGIRTALAMLAAEELDVDWNMVSIEQMDANPKYGDQLTGGSVSVSTYYTGMRLAGASARLMLVSAAAQAWDVDPAQCTTGSGQVIHPDGQQKSAYGDLVESASKLELPKGVKLKDVSTFKLVGTDIGHWDAPKIVTGQAVYGLDVRLPGMLFAAIARCPVFSGKFISHDDSAAKAVAGVRQIVELDDRIAVVADNSWAAIQGRNALKITWDEGSHNKLSSQELFDTAIKNLPAAGSAGTGFIEAIYTTPYEAHATMEPMNCTAYIHDGKCEVWAPTQNPQEVQRTVAGVTGLDAIVHVPLIGGGFGRRLQSDYAREAAQLAQAINQPVQVLWTRDDDLQHDFYQAMSIQYFSADLKKLAMPRARNSGGRIVPTGAWRSVLNFAEAYGVQCFIDEMAVAVGRDPLELRLELYQTRELALGVIKLAAEKAGWGSPLPDGHFHGMAYHATFGVTHVAYVAEVSVDKTGMVRVHKVVAAVDCGQVVNPNNVAAQMEGGIVFGLTAALKAQSVLKDGRMQESNFHEYPLLRMDEMPLVETYIVPSDRSPSGIGEMGVPPIAPAVANAVFAAIGKRVRHIPIQPEDLSA